MYRNSNYDELLATKLNSEEFAQEYLLSLVEDPDEPMTIEEALRFAIPKMGVSEFCLKSGIRKQNVNDFLNERYSPKNDRLNRFLIPFGLKARLTLEKVA